MASSSTCRRNPGTVSRMSLRNWATARILLARQMKSKQSFVVGVIVSDITSLLSPILLKGISDCCDRFGYRILIANSDDEPRKATDYIMSMIDQSVKASS